MKASAGNFYMQSEINSIANNINRTYFKNKRALVTGGAGFLGSWVCETLINLGVYVLCVDNLSSGLKQNIAHLLDRENFKFIQHDITQEFLPNSRLDLVIHMASRASPFEFEKYPLEILKSNTIGTINALEIARKFGARFLFTSTSETYGNPAIVPTPESYLGNVNSIGIRGCYDESKRCGEAYVIAYHRQYNLDVRIARIFNTYGPRMRADGIYGRAVPRFLTQALKNEPITIFGDGKQTRSFCYVTDQIEGLLKFISTDNLNGEVINIGNNSEVTIMELADTIKKLTESSSEIIFSPLPQDDPLRRCPDITKAKNLLDWTPKVNLQTGLKKTIDWLLRTDLR